MTSLQQHWSSRVFEHPRTMLGKIVMLLLEVDLVVEIKTASVEEVVETLWSADLGVT